nr:hypothetical protein [Pseudomonas sp. P818]
MADKTPIDYVGGPVGAVSSHGEAGVGEVLKPAARPNKAELRRLAHDASENEMGWLDAERLKRMMVDEWADFVAEATPNVVLSLLEECESLERFKAAYMEWQEKTDWVRKDAKPKELGMHVADVMTARITKAEDERDAALAELEAMRGLLVQCTLSAETLRTDSLGHAQHCGFGDRMVSAMRRLSGVKPGHGLGSRDYPSQAASIDAAMSQEAPNA